MMIEPTWWKYALFDDDGICGISNDAPEEEKEKYRQYVEEREQIIKEGKRIPR